jgi:hypothetical protein
MTATVTPITTARATHDAELRLIQLTDKLAAAAIQPLTEATRLQMTGLVDAASAILTGAAPLTQPRA